MEDSERVTVRLPAGLLAALSDAALAGGRSVSQEVRYRLTGACCRGDVPELRFEEPSKFDTSTEAQRARNEAEDLGIVTKTDLDLAEDHRRVAEERKQLVEKGKRVVKLPPKEARVAQFDPAGGNLLGTGEAGAHAWDRLPPPSADGEKKSYQPDFK